MAPASVGLITDRLRTVCPDISKQKGEEQPMRQGPGTQSGTNPVPDRHALAEGDYNDHGCCLSLLEDIGHVADGVVDHELVEPKLGG
eukprot:4865063-Heterocapsa_arctica.AAC.1